MAAGCCHPILAWIGSLLLIFVSAFLSLFIVFTTLSGRPDTYGDKYRPEVRLTVHEEVILSHAALLVICAVFLQNALSLISRGEHRDEKFHIEAAFIILAAVVILLSVVNLILVVVVSTMAETMVDFEHEQSLTSKNLEFFYGTTTVEYTLPERHEDAKTLVFTLIGLDAVSLLLIVIGTILVTGCNKREKYVFHRLLERKRSGGYRSYRTVAVTGTGSIEAEDV